MDSIFGSPVTQTLIGVVTVWFLVAMLCSGIVQLVSMLFGFKANHLWSALERVLTTDAETQSRVAAGEAGRLTRKPRLEHITDQPLDRFITMLPGVARTNVRRVSHVSPTAAVSALIAARDADEESITQAHRRFAATPLGELVEHLPAAIRTDTDRMHAWFTSWFDDEMERLRISYRSKIRWWAAAIGVAVALLLGINSLQVARDLWNEPARREVVVTAADKIVADGGAADCTPASGDDEGTLQDQITCVRDQADGILTLEVSAWQGGWPDDARGWADQLAGMAVTAGAIAAGSSFWFDVLKRLMGLRPTTAAS